jgi:preprotein translocase subunit SecE
MDQSTTTTRTSVPLPKSRRGLRGFLGEVGRELKKVSWPTRSETNRLTGVVLAVSLFVIVFLTVLSSIFGTAMKVLTEGF